MNECQLIGRLTKDPELKTTPQGTAVVSFTLAVERKFNREKVDFIDIVAWRQTAEHISRYFRKGNRMGLVGSIQTRNWEDNNGNHRKAVEVVAESAYFADGKKEGEAGAPQSDTYAPADPNDFDDSQVPFRG